jgi:hypothetical protein
MVMPSTRAFFGFWAYLYPVLTPSPPVLESHLTQIPIQQRTSREPLYAKDDSLAPVGGLGDSAARALRIGICRFVLSLCLMALLGIKLQAQTATANRDNGSQRTAATDSLKSGADVFVMRLEELTVELRLLRLELLEQRLDGLTASISSIERELRQLQNGRQSLTERELAINHEIFALDQQLKEPTLSADEQAELEDARASLIMRAQTDRDKASLTQRETELTQRFQQVQQQRQNLLERLKRLTGEMGRTR